MYDVEWKNSASGTRYTERFGTEENARLFFASLQGRRASVEHITLRAPGGKVLDAWASETAER